MRSTKRRLAARAAMYLAAGLAVLVLVIHTPLVRQPLLSWVTGWLAQDAGLRLDVTDFDYNLLSRRVTVRGLRLAALGHEQTPLFTAGEIDVRLPWSIYAGQAVIQHLHLADAVVTIATDANGVSNLPPSTDAPVPEPPTRLDLRALTVRNLDFVYLDAETDTDVRIGGLRVDLGPAGDQQPGIVTGTIAADGGIAVRYEAQRTASRPAEGRVTFDGSTVVVEPLRLSFPEADTTLAGRVTRVLDTAVLDLRLDATARLPESAKWMDPPMPVTGTAAVTGTIAGPLGEVVIDGTFVSDNIVLGTADGLRLTGNVRITPETFALSQVTLTKGQASADAQVTVPFDEAASATVKAAWRQFPIDAVLAIAGLEDAPVGALLDGSLSADLGAGPAPQLAVVFENRARASARRGSLPVDGRTSVNVSDGRWRATARHTVADALEFDADLSGTLDAVDAANSTVAGPIDLRVTDLARLAGALRRAGIDTPAFLADSSGRLSAAARVGGRMGMPSVTGTVASEDLVLADAGPASFGLSLTATPDGVRVEDLRLTVADTVLEADARVILPGGAIDGRFRLEAPALDRALAMLPAESRPAGSASVAGTLGGTLDLPRAAASVSVDNLVVGAQRLDSVRARLRATPEWIDIDTLTVTQGDGRLDATGRYGLSKGAYVADIEARGLAIEGVADTAPGARALIDLTFSGRGTLDRPVGRGRVTVNLEGGSLETLVGAGSADITLDGATARVHVVVPKLGADFDGTIAPVSPYAYRAVAVLNQLDLAPLALLGGAREGTVRGTLSLNTTLTGNLVDTGSLAAAIDIRHLAAEVNGVPVALAAPARLRWDGDAFEAGDVHVRLGSGELRATGRIARNEGRGWTAALRADAADLLTIARAFPDIPAELAAGGAVRIDWTSARGWASPDVTLGITGGTLAWADLPPVTGLGLEASFDGVAVDVTRLAGSWQDGGIAATARLPLSLLATDTSRTPADRGFARARLTGLTPAALAPWVEASTLTGVSGRLSATLDVEIDEPTPAGVRGTLVLDEAAVTIEGVVIEQQQPSRLTMADGQLRVDDVRWTAGGSPLVLGGSVDLVADDPVLDLSLTGRADLRIVSAFDPTVAADGSAALDVRIRGTVATPLFAGSITLDDTELALTDPPVVLSGVRGLIRLADNRISFENFTGEANGGRLTVTGGLDTAGLELTGGAVELRLDGVALEYPPGLQSEADARLQFTPNPGGPRLSGRVRILRSAYLAPFSFPAMIAANRAVALPVRRAPSYADTIRLDIAVETVTDTVVDNNYGRFEAGTEVRLVGTIADPGITGRATLREGGQVYLAGNTFRVERGNVSFISPTGIEPDLDIRVRALVSGQDVTLTISGTLDRLETDVRSADPTVPADELVSLLLGSSGGGFGSAEALTLLSSELLGATGRAVGLDTLRLERGFTGDELMVDPGLIASETDPSARLTMSKRLRPNVELILSQNLRESGLSAVLSYRPRRNIELRGVSRDNLDRAYSVRHEITVGGGATTAAVTPPVTLRVSAVAVTGSGVDEADLRRRLRLETGDRFSFYTWQRDIDTLRSHFHALGRYEARVRASRESDEGAGTIALTYHVEPGPATELAITGYSLPGRFTTELERAWARTVVDQFLVRDLVARTRRFLIGRGLFGSEVLAAVERPSADRKIVRLTIEPGTAVARREIRFEGRQALDEGVLRGAIASAGLNIEAWLSPGRIRQPIEDTYAVEGYLDVRVEPGQPELEGDRAVLVVRIDEGPRYTVGAVAVEGVAASRIEGVRKGVGLPAGEFYTSEAIEQARRRVERMYWRQGFNAVRVDVQPALDQAAARVDVALVVAEGPQQVLTEVVKSGRSRTRPGVVERALRLPIGEPVDLNEWALARKRLYDTGVFRQVDLEPEPMGEPVDGVERVRARVTVQEWPAWRLRYGLQVNDTQPEEEALSLPGESTGRSQSLGVVADLRSQNLFGRAIGTGLFGLLERDRRSVSANVAFPRLVGLPVSTNVFLFGEREDVNVADQLAFVNDRSGVSAEQRWRRSRGTQVSWSYRFERTHTYDPAASADDLFPLDVRFNVGRFSVTTLLDRRDDPFNTKVGWFSSASFEYAAPAIGSDLRMAKLYVQQKYFRPLGPVVLAGFAQAGAAFADDLIPSERFRAGGGYTVRGYAENGLGPVDFLGRPRGGNALLTLNHEVRFPVFKWARGVAFLDAGNVFAQRSELSITGLKVGYGLGLRLDTPFAMLRIDYGLPASRGPGQPRGRWYFGVGHVF